MQESRKVDCSQYDSNWRQCIKTTQNFEKFDPLPNKYESFSNIFLELIKITHIEWGVQSKRYLPKCNRCELFGIRGFGSDS